MIKKTADKAGRAGRDIADLDIPADARRFLESRGFASLYPPQQAAVDAGLLEGRGLLVSAPTASGKTLIATLAIIAHMAAGRGGKVVYLSPLRALAAEKYAEFAALSEIRAAGSGWHRRDSGSSKIRTARLTGERAGLTTGSRGPTIRDADVVVATNEAMDAAMRLGLDWTDEIGLVIADEIHLIGDPVRGPTLEMVLTQLKRRQGGDGLQVVGLSATVSNDGEIARWLGCRLVKSDWRPVRLAEGVCDDHGTISMSDGRRLEVGGAGAAGLPAKLGAMSVAEGGQSLIFASTRPSSRAMAKRASKLVDATLTARDRRSLSRIASKILGSPVEPPAKDGPGTKKKAKPSGPGAAGGAAAASRAKSADASSSGPTELERELAALVQHGVAFHHAGLSDKIRSIIEGEFRGGAIKLIASTPTLAAGVNLPARRVIISTIGRYNAMYGCNMPISVLEYKQLCGRAGRPQYDDYGESIACASAMEDADGLFDDYVMGQTEPIESHIIDERAMRTHLLTVVVLNPGVASGMIRSFFADTLAGHQSGSDEIKCAVGEALEFLLEHDMVVEKGGRYAATALGKRTSSLYVDPVTASYLRNVAGNAPGEADGEWQPGAGKKPARHTLGFLHAITSCAEFVPKQSIGKAQYDIAQSLLYGPHQSELLSPVYPDECSRGLLVLHDWVSERTEKEIESALKTQSGDLHRMVENAAWLAYVMREMAKHEKREDVVMELDVLRFRLKSGIKEELVSLARMRGVGRVRARALYKNGIRNTRDVRNTPVAKLAAIRQIGPTVAASIKREIEASLWTK